MLFIVGIRVYLMIWLHTKHILISVIAEEKKRDSVTEVKSCLKMKTNMTGDSCFLNIWDRNGISIYSSEGNDYNEECYDSEQCYSVGMGEGGDDGGKCSVDVTINEETVEQGFIKDKYFRIGDCSNNSCEGKTEMFPMSFYGKELDYYRKIAGESEARWDYINPGESTDGNLASGESESICFNMTQCNILQSRKGDLSYYYLLEGGNVVESGELDDFATFGDCSTICNDLVLFINATHGGGGFDYSLSEDDQIIEKYIEEGHVDSICINKNKCTTISGNGNATYKILHNGQLEKSVNHSDYYMFGKCTCGYKPLFLIDSTRGEDIFRLLSSIWGMEVFIDVTSPQYMTACWLVKYDQQNLNATAANIIQRYVMGLLFYATDGWNWYSYYGFMSSKHECSWTDDTQISQRKGVICSNGKILKAIGLESNNLIGMLVSEIYTLAQVSNLADLEVIWLANNQLSGTLPVSMREFAFKYFDLDGNELQGSLPEDLFSLKGSFKINANQFTGTLPSIDINRDIELTELQISNNKISGTIPSGIGRASNLTLLNLSFNNITGKIPASITKLSKLSNLYLNSNELSGTLPSHIFTLIKLKVINFSYNRLSGIIPTEFGLGNILYDLALDYNLLSGSIPSELSTELTKLKHLFLSNNILNGNITLNMPNLITQLDTLYIENNQITGHIQECHETMIHADCYTPRDIVCECCQCVGIFNTPTAYVKEFPECASTELKIIFHNKMNEQVGFDLFNEVNEYILQDFKIADSEDTKYTTCISTTDCYVLSNHFRRPYDLIIDNTMIYSKSYDLIDTTGNTISYEYIFDNTIILANNDDLTSFGVGHNALKDLIFYNTTILANNDDLTSFGYSGTDTLALKNCKNYSICDIILIPGTEERSSFNRLFNSIHNLNDFENQTSFQYQTLCWWLKDIQLTGLRDSYVIIQRYLLALLYYHTNGEQWNQSTSWLSQESACNWYGITCKKDLTLITKIDLTENGLDGFIPTELGELKGLEHLILSSNKLTGPLPQEIGKLENLMELKLSSNELKGSLPSHICFLKYLEELDLSSNVFTNTIPLEIGVLESIEILKLSNNSFLGELSSQIKSLTNLKVFNVSQNLFQGNTTALKNLKKLTLIDLSNNYFKGSSPIFGSTHNKLRILHINGNIFSGSIPTTLGEMVELEELLLYDNNLWGTLPSEIGILTNISKISISYNKIKGTIPKEIGNLHQLKLLHLHSNLLEGTADHFVDAHSIKSFISDCGSTATEVRLVDCTTCTQCCNEEEECITERNTWPGDSVRNIKVTWSVSTKAAIFILLLVGWLCMVFITMALFLVKEKLPKLSYLNTYGDQFQKDSVYRFFLSSNKHGWFIACLTTMFQLWILVFFFVAADKTADTNDVLYLDECTSDNLECINKGHVEITAWVSFAGILASFIIPDLLDGFYLFYASSTCNRLDVKGAIFGVLIASVPVLSIVASCIYLSATTVSSAVLLKDSVAILFLNQIDEQVLKLVVRVIPSWAKTIEEDIAERYNEQTIPIELERIENETSEVRYNTAIDVAEEQSPQRQDSSSTDLDGSNNIDSLCRQIQEIKKEREIDKQLIFEMWNILARFNVQPDDLNSAQHVAGVNISSRQAMIQNFNSKIRENYATSLYNDPQSYVMYTAKKFHEIVTHNYSLGHFPTGEDHIWPNFVRQCDSTIESNGRVKSLDGFKSDVRRLAGELKDRDIIFYHDL